jgi:hypothetical protein
MRGGACRELIYYEIGIFGSGRRKQTAPYAKSRAPTAFRPSVRNDEAEVWPFAASALPYEKTAAVGAVCVTANTPMHGRSGRRRAVRRSAGVHTGKSTRIGSRRDRAACTTAPVLSQDALRRGPAIYVGRTAAYGATLERSVDGRPLTAKQSVARRSADPAVRSST